MKTSFIKKRSIFVNTDQKSYMNHKSLKQRLLSQQDCISDLNNRIDKLEKLILDKN